MNTALLRGEEAHENCLCSRFTQRFGHWEGDSVLGTKSRGDGIHTEVERHTRLLRATKVAALTSQEGVDAQKRLFAALPEHARCSTTMDNGTEMHLHTELVTDYEALRPDVHEVLR